MQAVYLIAKFFASLVHYLFWGKSWITGVVKIVLWFLLLFLSLKPTDRLVLAKGGAPVLSWLDLETETWVKLVFVSTALLLAFGAACVRVKSLVFKVGNGLVLDRGSGIFRLSVDRRGWLVNIEAPPATVQRVVDEQGNSAFPAAPFELIWSHQHPLGVRPLFSGRGPRNIDVFIVKQLTVSESALCFCGINGNTLRFDQSIRLNKARKLWVEISVAEDTRWFLVEPDPKAPAPAWFRVTHELPSNLPLDIRQLFISNSKATAVTLAAFVLVPSLVGFAMVGMPGLITGGLVGFFLALVWFATRNDCSTA